MRKLFAVKPEDPRIKCKVTQDDSDVDFSLHSTHQKLCAPACKWLELQYRKTYINRNSVKWTRDIISHSQINQTVKS